MLIFFQVEYGATQPGTTHRLPKVGDLDQRVTLKQQGLPTLLYCPSFHEILQHIPMVILFILSRITPIALMVTYIHTYTLVPMSVIIVLQILIGWRLLKLKIMDSVLSAFLSISQPAPYQVKSTPNFIVKVSTNCKPQLNIHTVT